MEKLARCIAIIATDIERAAIIIRRQKLNIVIVARRSYTIAIVIPKHTSYIKRHRSDIHRHRPRITKKNGIMSRLNTKTPEIKLIYGKKILAKTD